MMVGLGRFELPTPRLSSVCSNQLSYRPTKHRLFKEPSTLEPASAFASATQAYPVLSKLDRTQTTTVRCKTVHLRACALRWTIHVKYQIDPRIFPEGKL